jgi:hypothetical protein
MIGGKHLSTKIIAALLLLFAVNAQAGALDKIRFIKVAPKDEKGVIKEADGKLRVIKPGDTIGETVRVVSISEGRVVIEEMTATGPETIIVRIENGGQRFERVRKQAELRPAPVEAAPVKRSSDGSM